MTFRVATLNMEQDHKRWEQRRELIVEHLDELRPDIFTLNEISISMQTGRWLQRVARERLGIGYALIQQAKPGGAPDGEGILTTYPVIETANLDYRARGAVAQVARLDVDGRLVDFYVTHLYMSRGEDSLRLYQVQQLLEWVSARDDVDARVVCGDFNATLDAPSAGLMARHFKPSQTEHTAFTPLEGEDGEPSHMYWDRLDRCIDYIWVSGALKVRESMVCFNRPSPTDPTLWPSDHAGVWADIELT